MTCRSVISSAATAECQRGSVAAGTAVYTAIAADPAGGTVIYSLTGADASAFSINGSTGVITINNTPDFQTKSSYSYSVKASDPSGQFNTEMVTLSVNDVAPTITSGVSATVVEGTPVITPVYTATATDVVNSPITYSLAGTNAAEFNIDAVTGIVTLKAVANHQTQASYSFDIVASDGTLTSSETVTLAVTGVTAATSSVTASPGSVTANGTSTTTLTVTAEDASGHLIAGATVTLSATGSDNSFAPVSGVTDANGVFTATLASTLAQGETVSALIDGAVTETTSVNFTAGAPAQATSSVSAAPATVLADGVHTTTLTVTVEDAQGNPISGATVSLSDDGSGNGYSATTGVTNANGVFTATLDSTAVQNETITATIDGTITETTTVDFVSAGDHWTNHAGGDWSVAGNWSDGVPNLTDAALIDASGTYTVTSSSDVSVSSLSTVAGATFDITAGTMTVTGTGSSTVDGAVENSGTSDVQNGTR